MSEALPESLVSKGNPAIEGGWQTARATLAEFFGSVGERHLLEAAGSIAFRFFLSTVPLLVFVGYVIGRLAKARGIDDLIDPISEIAPAVTDDLLRSELTRLANVQGAGVAPLSIVSFLWMVSSGAHNLQNVFAMVFRAQRRPWWMQRGIALAWTVAVVVFAVGASWGRMVIDVALHPEDSHPIAAIVHPMGLANARVRAGFAPSVAEAIRAHHIRARKRRLARHGLLAPIADASHVATPHAVAHAGARLTDAAVARDHAAQFEDVPPLADASAEPIDGAVPLVPYTASPAAPSNVPGEIDTPPPVQRSVLEHVLTFLVCLALGTAVLAVFYRYAVQHPPNVRRRVWPGALMAVIAWLAMSWGFGFYMRSLDRYTVYYGSLAAVAVLQLWLFFTSLVLLLGGQVNAMLEARDRPGAGRDR